MIKLPNLKLSKEEKKFVKIAESYSNLYDKQADSVYVTFDAIFKSDIFEYCTCGYDNNQKMYFINDNLVKLVTNHDLEETYNELLKRILYVDKFFNYVGILSHVMDQYPQDVFDSLYYSLNSNSLKNNTSYLEDIVQKYSLDKESKSFKKLDLLFEKLHLVMTRVYNYNQQWRSSAYDC